MYCIRFQRGNKNNHHAVTIVQEFLGVHQRCYRDQLESRTCVAGDEEFQILAS